MTDDRPQNRAAPVIELYHAALVRLDNESIYKSICPVCGEGVLLLQRDLNTFELMAEDHCYLCGQRYKYKDIEALRAKERG